MSDTTTRSTDSTLPAELPALPLRNTVVLPLTIQPLAVDRPHSIEAVNRALTGDRMILLALQRGDAAQPGEEDLRRVGTVGVIRQMAKGQAGLQVLVEGLARVRVTGYMTGDNHLRASITPAPEPVDPSLELEAYMRRLRELTERALSLATGIPSDLRPLLESIEEPLRLCYVLASMLDMKAEDKQLLLEEDDLLVKVRAVTQSLSREVELLALKGKIESEAQQEMSDQQRQYYLRQQLKKIREELGETEGEEVQDLRQRVEEAKLPEHVASAVGREIDRLERMPPASPDYQMIRTYLDWVLEVPWSVTTEDRLDPVAAQQVLDEDHYDLAKVKERIVEYLAVRKLKGDLKGPILCFVGPPGVGKTSLGQSIARAMNRKFVRISLGGVRDEAEIRGHRRTYIGSMPGRIIQALKQAGSANPVFMLDEIDKLAAGFQGDPAAALLEVLDPAQNNTFRDHYLEVPFDLSRVLFITTANQLGPVHPALQDRMEVITLGGYTEGEKVHIARQYLIPRQVQEHGLAEGSVEITEPALRRIITGYTREAGVRNLERQIGTVARKIAARIAGVLPEQERSPEGTTARPNTTASPMSEAVGRIEARVANQTPSSAAPQATIVASSAEVRSTDAENTVSPSLPQHWTVDADDIPGYLGPPRIRSETAFRTSRPGVATGLAWTEAGGDVLFVEATLVPGGSGQLVLTGQLGDVMQESARAALSHVRASATGLGIPTDFLRKHDIHVHVPAGAIPKDGPSAGVTMATAIVSAATNISVRDDVAMTGEITLSGLVLPVGGIREKALAAKRHGIKTLIMPDHNRQDLDELPAEARDEMTFVPVGTLEEVLKVAMPAPARGQESGARSAPKASEGRNQVPRTKR
ncbi:MAG: endopeptidase La [Luteitalea sp.]|nr:endopeptidase La [Luteitalea sp.]